MNLIKDLFYISINPINYIISKYFDIFELNNTYNYNAKRSKLRIFHSYKSAAQDSEANDESRGNNDQSLIYELMQKKEGSR